MASQSSPAPSPKLASRAAVRLLQPSCLQPDTGGGSPVECGSPRTPQLPPAPLASPGGRRRSIGFPEGEALALDVDLESPSRLSLPLTLLSLNNGGVSMRHATRSSRDVSPLASILIREGSVSTGQLNPGDGMTGRSAFPGSARGSSDGSRSVGGGTAPASLPSPSGRPSNLQPASVPPAALSPSGRSLAQTSAALLGSSLSPLSSYRTSSLPAPSSTAPRENTGLWLDTPSSPSHPHAAAASPSQPPASPSHPHAAASATGVLSSPGGTASFAVPGHLCPNRPPTPLTKDDDLLMASLRHMSSPGRGRRSRFAGPGDTGLLAAAAAAVAAEEEGLLESPPGSFSGGGAGFAESRRRALAAATSGERSVSGSGSGSGSGPAGSLSGTGEWPGSPGRTSRRLPLNLGTVPEDLPAMAAHARGDAFPSPSGGSLSSGGGSFSGGAVAGRRQRGPGPSPASQTGMLSPGSFTLTRAQAGPGGAHSGSGGAHASSGAANDALSSFMTSFGPGSPRAGTPAMGSIVGSLPPAW